MKHVVIVRPFAKADALELRSTISLGTNLTDWAANVDLSGQPAFTGLIDGKIAGCGGVVILWPGCGEAWSVFADWARDYKRQMLVTCRRFIYETMASHKLRRVQASLRTDLPSSWLIHLGFQCEGVMRKYCADGCDATMWAIVKL